MKKKKIIQTLSVFVLVSTLIYGCNKNDPKPDPKTQFEIMFNNVKNMIVENTPISEYEGKSKQEILSGISKRTYAGVLDDINETYYFNDVDYSNQDIVVWTTSKHITKALQIAVLGARNNDNDLLKTAYKLSSFWLCNDFKLKGNWWWNSIGIPRDLSDLAFFTYPMSTKNEKEKLLEIIRAGSFLYTEKTHTSTGCNLFDYASITLKSAVLSENQEELDTITTYLLPGIYEDQPEGFQRDGSFFQHGRMIQSGSYGRQGLSRLIRIGSAYHGTGKNIFSEEHLRIISNFAANGLKYLLHKGYFNYSALGRTYSRATALDIHGGSTDLSNVSDIKYLLKFENLPYKSELTQLLDDINANRPTFSGLKVFPMSALVTMNLDGVYLSFRGSDEKIVNTEAINGENVLGYNISYGTNTCIMSTGKEYYNISPVWNFSYLPGTTTIDETDAELESHKSLSSTLKGTFNTTYTSDDQSSAVSMYKTNIDQDHPISRTVTCFATLQGMVLLGAGLSHSKGKQLHTSVEQCISANAPTISANHKDVTRDNVLYRNLDEQEFTVNYQEITNSWNRNNRSFFGNATEKVLSINLELNEKDNYAYSIQPASMSNARFAVAHNDGDYQAIVLPDGKAMLASFYKDGSFEYNGHTYEGKKGEAKLINIL